MLTSLPALGVLIMVQSKVAVGGACKHIHHLLLLSAKARGLTTSILTLRGPENIWASLCTPTSSHISVVAFQSSASRLKKGGEKKGEKVKKEK
jgi:hypothetical protein